MNKKLLLLISSITLILIAGFVVLLFSTNEVRAPESPLASQSLQESVTTDAVSPQEQPTAQPYVRLADYNARPSSYGSQKLVYFFHAQWCSICRDIELDLKADQAKIPTGVTIVETDFDTERDLRMRFGVTTQYTFVQVDASGNEIKQWSATSAERALSQIQ